MVAQLQAYGLYATGQVQSQFTTELGLQNGVTKKFHCSGAVLNLVSEPV